MQELSCGGDGKSPPNGDVAPIYAVFVEDGNHYLPNRSQEPENEREQKLSLTYAATITAADRNAIHFG